LKSFCKFGEEECVVARILLTDTCELTQIAGTWKAIAATSLRINIKVFKIAVDKRHIGIQRETLLSISPFSMSVCLELNVPRPIN